MDNQKICKFVFWCPTCQENHRSEEVAAIYFDLLLTAEGALPKRECQGCIDFGNEIMEDFGLTSNQT